jgi:hypothetical protein
MPLWKLQTLRRRNVPFLYEKSSGPRITLLPGVGFNLRRFGALIQLLARSAWVQHIRSNPRNAPTVGGATKQDPQGEFEIHGQCRPAVPGDTKGVTFFRGDDETGEMV